MILHFQRKVTYTIFVILAPSGEPWMVVEFMRYGDLADVLRTNSGVLSLQRNDSPILEMVSNSIRK